MVPKCSTYEMDLEKRALKKHLRIHSVGLTCRSTFATERLQVSNRPVISKDDRPFKCNQCSKCFKRRGYLNAHLQRHLSECEALSFGFTRQT